MEHACLLGLLEEVQQHLRRHLREHARRTVVFVEEDHGGHRFQDELHAELSKWIRHNMNTTT